MRVDILTEVDMTKFRKGDRVKVQNSKSFGEWFDPWYGVVISARSREYITVQPDGARDYVLVWKLPSFRIEKEV